MIEKQPITEKQFFTALGKGDLTTAQELFLSTTRNPGINNALYLRLGDICGMREDVDVDNETGSNRYRILRAEARGRIVTGLDHVIKDLTSPSDGTLEGNEIEVNRRPLSDLEKSRIVQEYQRAWHEMSHPPGKKCFNLKVRLIPELTVRANRIIIVIQMDKKEEHGNVLVYLLIAVVVLGLLFVGYKKLSHHFLANSNSPLISTQTNYSPSPVPSTSADSSTSGGLSNTTDNSNAQLDKDLNQIGNSMNKLDQDSSTVNQDPGKASADNPNQ